MARLRDSYRSAPATYSLLTLIVVVFVAGSLVGPRTLLVLGANAGPLVLAGDWWRPLSAVLLHANFLHLAMNGLALYQLGRLFEWTFGSSTTLAMFVFTGLTGSALSLFNEAFSVGASGAIFGLAGALVSFFLRHRERLTPAGIALLKQLLAWSVLVLVLGFTVPNIDWRGHVGGLVGGMAVGWALHPRRGREGRFAHVAAFIAVAFLVAALVGMIVGRGALRGPGRMANAAVYGFETPRVPW